MSDFPGAFRDVVPKVFIELCNLRTYRKVGYAHPAAAMPPSASGCYTSGLVSQLADVAIMLTESGHNG